MDFIVRQKGFWAEDDDSVLKAIHEGFLQTHYAMWKELEKWPKTVFCEGFWPNLGILESTG